MYALKGNIKVAKIKNIYIADKMTNNWDSYKKNKRESIDNNQWQNYANQSIKST